MPADLKAFFSSNLLAFKASTLAARDRSITAPEITLEAASQIFIDRHPTLGTLDDDDMSGWEINP